MGTLVVKNPRANAGDAEDVGSIPGLGWRRHNNTPICLPGEFHGQRSLQATVQGVAKSQTGLNQLSMYACTLKQTLPDRLFIVYIASHLPDIYENKTI